MAKLSKETVRSHTEALAAAGRHDLAAPGGLPPAAEAPALEPLAKVGWHPILPSARLGEANVRQRLLRARCLRSSPAGLRRPGGASAPFFSTKHDPWVRTFFSEHP